MAPALLGSPIYLAAYLVSAASVIGIIVGTLVLSKKVNTKIPPSRIFPLAKEETKRLFSGDSVFLMHVSIALGVGLSILIALLDPFLPSFPVFRIILLVITIPLIVGLFAAFGWRIERYYGSKRAQKQVQTSEEFNRASAYLQMILILAVLLTASELVLAWFSNLSVVDFGLDVVRNSLVVLYYAKPSINLVSQFDRPLPTMRVPFKLSDVMEGKVDSSDVVIGASKVSEFPPYQKLSYDSCVEIGACEAACPATRAGRPLSPRIVVRKASMLDGKSRKEGRDADPFETITEDELWSCVTCGACVEACPVSVKHLDTIYDLRRTLVNTGRMDKDKSTLLQNLVQNQNPYGFNSASRGDWAKDEQGIETLATNPNAEYLYWVGCIASFDQRAQGIAKALAKTMKAAGLSFAILSSEEACNGDPARRLGEEGRYQELAYQNIEKLNSYKVRKIVTSCPHCYNTLKNEYPAFGGKYEVIHHTQLVSDLIRDGRIKIPRDKVGEISVTLHDACYAARYNSIFDEPREILSVAGNGGGLKEMHRRKEKTFCCGAGGSNYWYKMTKQERSIASIRIEEALGTGATTLATECPFCLSMFEDSLRVGGNSERMRVRDVVEIVAEELGRSAEGPS